MLYPLWCLVLTFSAHLIEERALELIACLVIYLHILAVCACSSSFALSLGIGGRWHSRILAFYEFQYYSLLLKQDLQTCLPGSILLKLLLFVKLIVSLYLEKVSFI